MSLLSQHLLPTCQSFGLHGPVYTIALFNSNQADGSSPVAEIGTITSIVNATIENQVLHLNYGALTIEPEYIASGPEDFTFEIIIKGTAIPYFDFSPIDDATLLAANGESKGLFTEYSHIGWINQISLAKITQPYTHIVASRKNKAWAFWQNGVLLASTAPSQGSLIYGGSPLPIHLGLYTYNNAYSYAEILGCRVMQGNPYSHGTNISIPNWPLKPLFID